MLYCCWPSGLQLFEVTSHISLQPHHIAGNPMPHVSKRQWVITNSHAET
jgi:hypothetical protein